MDVILELLSPRVKHRKVTDFRQATSSLCDFFERCFDAAKEHVENEFAIVE